MSSSTLASSPTVLLARHGRTAHNATGRFQGRLDVPLDAEGERQAQALAEVAQARGGVAVVVTSPLLRARDTARAVAERLEVPLREDDRWVEVDVGDWTDRPHAEAGPDALAAFRALQVPAPGGEPFAAVERRVLEALGALEPDALVVSHGIALAVTLRALGLPPRRLGNAELLSVPARALGG